MLNDVIALLRLHIGYLSHNLVLGLLATRLMYTLQVGPHLMSSAAVGRVELLAVAKAISDYFPSVRIVVPPISVAIRVYCSVRAFYFTRDLLIEVADVDSKE
jgi:hypothetical protein